MDVTTAQSWYGAPWEILEYDLAQEKAEDRINFWKNLNEHAVNARGESALREFKIVNN